MEGFAGCRQRDLWLRSSVVQQRNELRQVSHHSRGRAPEAPDRPAAEPVNGAEPRELGRHNRPFNTLLDVVLCKHNFASPFCTGQTPSRLPIGKRK